MADSTLTKPPMFDRTPQPYSMSDGPTVAVPVVKPYPIPIGTVEKPVNGCSCQSGSGFEQKVKENPLIFVLGALALGYFLGKK